MLPTAVGLRKVIMSDKWQQISLKLDADLAQALREMKQGHDESLSEVVVRVLKRAVRQSSPTALRPARGERPVRGERPMRGERPVRGGRSNATGGSGRGAVGTGRKGKPVISAGRAGSGAAARGKPWAAPAASASEWAESGKPAPAWAAPQRGLRRSTGKPGKPGPGKPGPGKPGRAPRPQQLEGSAEPRRRSFRTSAGGPRPSEALGTTSERPRRPRKAKGRPSNGR